MTSKTVLIIDDTEMMADFLELNFKNNGFAVRTAYSFKEAKEILEKESCSPSAFCAVISDRELGDNDGDGTDLLKIVEENFPSARRFLMSGSTEPKEHNAEQFLLKPFNPDIIINKLKAVT